MDGNAKQDVAEKLRSSTSVLVTVSKDPTVDQLSAALGLSLMLTKLGKHTTTVFSGQIPNTMEFLEPDKTFDSTVDGLRDFIISLDKDKADKLRYKVEDNVVKIFITPYKSKISQDDLNFSQGDFNVDLVVALGVHKREDLDNAITSHGRILHDAAIVTINAAGNGDGNLGAVDWSDTNASCLSEMLVSISEALEGGILDSQMSTAFLTGIVSATERFKNEKTSPKVMTMAAQLMAAGANQQLIATNLQITEPQIEVSKDANSDLTGSLVEEDQQVDIGKIDQEVEEAAKEELVPEPEHKDEPEPELVPKPKEKLSDIEDSVQANHNKLDDEGRTKKQDGEDPAIKALEDDLSNDSSLNLIDLESQMKTFEPPKKTEATHERAKPSFDEVKGMNTSAIEAEDKPMMGGTFNATAAEAHDRIEADKNKAINKEILSHDQSHLNQTSNHGVDVPSSADLMKDLEDARRAVEQAMGETEQNGVVPHASSALNAAPMQMDDGTVGSLNLSNNVSAAAPAPAQQTPQIQQNTFPQAPQQQMPSSMNNRQVQPPMPAPQIPQPQMNGQIPQQPVGNPMFNLPQQPMYPANGQPPGPGQQVMPPGQVPPQAAPPLPPNAPPPMPPFN